MILGHLLSRQLPRAAQTCRHLSSIHSQAGETGEGFRLDAAFVESFSQRPSPFGYQGLGEFVYRRTYSRPMADGTQEGWKDTVERVVNGTFSLQQRFLRQEGFSSRWDAGWARATAQEMFERVFDLRFVPPGRGLWAMGSPLTEERHLYAALNNCAFVSTGGWARREDPVRPFLFLMDASMLGVGVGFDTNGAGHLHIPASLPTATLEFVIPDSREGWVEALERLLRHYFDRAERPVFNFGQVRPAGVPIKGFGGISGGPEPLRELLSTVETVLDAHRGRALSVTGIVDIMNMIGRCIVSGNVRRTAEIAFGPADSEEFLDLKNYALNPQRANYGWTSNNSVLATPGMDYRPIVDRILANGEPGLIWLDNMRNYSRMGDAPDNKDFRAEGSNPCVEQTLESFELCCLVETFPARHSDKQDFLRTLELALLYAKTVTLGSTPWPESNAVMARNRRIGTSMSGIAQFIAQHGLDELRDWCDTGYAQLRADDEAFSKRFGVPTSIKLTSIKPSGTVSLLAGATPGMHYPISSHYIRRVRLPANSTLVSSLQNAGYHVEPAVEGQGTAVVEFPVCAGDHVPRANDVSLWDQLTLAAFLQRHWADNSVSCTVSFDPEKQGASTLTSALDHFQYQLKGISFLPNHPHVYPQMPYEEIDEATYLQRSANIKPVVWEQRDSFIPKEHEFCDGDKCVLPS